MKVIEFLTKNQSSRITVGKRWMTADDRGFNVFERKKYKRDTTILGEQLTEEQALKILSEGEELI